jgi:hypothetical protein
MTVRLRIEPHAETEVLARYGTADTDALRRRFLSGSPDAASR